MNFDKIFKYILSNPAAYPGEHLHPQPRSASHLKPLEPIAQFHVIKDTLSEYILNQLTNLKSVFVKNFGSFAIVVDKGNDKTIMNYTGGFTKQNDIKACFIIDNHLKNILSRDVCKQQVEVSGAQKSIFDQGYKTAYCNYSTIASKCYMTQKLVTSSLNNLFKAIYDLTNNGEHLELDFKVCKITINNKILKYNYCPGFLSQIKNKKTAESNGFGKTSSLWKTKPVANDDSKFNTNIINNKNYKQTLMLKLYSNDLNSISKISYCK